MRLSPALDTHATSFVRQALPALMRRHPLTTYFVMAYALSWLVLIPFILSECHVIGGDWRLAFVLNPFVGPAGAALVMTTLLEGEAGLHDLRRRLRLRRAPKWLYATILLGIPALLLIGIVLQPRSFTSFSGLTASVLVSYPFLFVAVLFGGGPLGEEIGWRGFALPRLQTRFGPLRASLLLGVLWGGWHLPHFLTSAQGGGPGTDLAAFLTNFPIFLGLVMSLSVILAWVVNQAHGSVFLAVVAHTSVNTPQIVLVPLFIGLSLTQLNLAALIGFGAFAMVVAVLTHGHLGYRASLKAAI